MTTPLQQRAREAGVSLTKTVTVPLPSHTQDDAALLWYRIIGNFLKTHETSNARFQFEFDQFDDGERCIRRCSLTGTVNKNDFELESDIQEKEKLKRLATELQRLQVQEKEQQERAEYLRLKQKFENK